MSNFSISILINALVFWYLHRFYARNKITIAKIKNGNILFVLSGLMVLILSTLAIYSALNWTSFAFLVPLLISSLWFSIQFYKTSNSIQDYVYLISIVILCGVVLYNLYANG